MQRNEIVSYLKTRPSSKPGEIADELGVSRQYIHRQLKSLLENKEIIATGSAPFVFYDVNPNRKELNLVYQASDPIPHYLYISPTGKRIEGFAGFTEWCTDPKRGLDPSKELPNYLTAIEELDKLREHGIIDATHKLKSSLSTTAVDKLYYSDIYSLVKFGKTRLGLLVTYAKQAQNKELMQEIVSLTKLNLLELIHREQIDAILYVPPTEKRVVQMMKILDKLYDFRLPKVEVIKARNPINVAQKTLSTLNERVLNARTTFVVRERAIYKNVLIIDDVVGSGASINEIAIKLRQQGVVKNKIIGFGLVGSLKGFDVVTRA